MAQQLNVLPEQAAKRLEGFLEDQNLDEPVRTLNYLRAICRWILLGEYEKRGSGNRVYVSKVGPMRLWNSDDEVKVYVVVSLMFTEVGIAELSSIQGASEQNMRNRYGAYVHANATAAVRSITCH